MVSDRGGRISSETDEYLFRNKHNEPSIRNDSGGIGRTI